MALTRSPGPLLSSPSGPPPGRPPGRASVRTTGPATRPACPSALRTCRCCDRHVHDPVRGLCGYCAARPDQGGCLGYHGEALRAYLDDRCAHGACTPELASWWIGQDDRHIARRSTTKFKTKS